MANSANAPATRKPGDLMAQFHAYMLQRARDNKTQSAERTKEIMESQAARILSADSVDAIWDADAGGALQMRDVPDTEWEFLDMAPVESSRTFDDGGENAHGYYVSCNAVFLGGDEKIVRQFGLTLGETYALQTGAELITTKLRAFENVGAFPLRAKVQAITTGSGRTVLKLAKLNRRLTTAEPIKGEVA